MNLKIFIALFLSVFFAACSFKAPINQWEINSANAYNSYTKNFLKQNLEIANSDLNSAIKYAKQSANLNQLSRIYLGKCALNNSIGIEDKCLEYIKIKDLVQSNKLKAYYQMLKDDLSLENMNFLPKQYKDFYKYKLEKNYEKAFESLKSSEQITSLFLASSLIQNNLTKTQIEYLIEKASFYGYKSLVLFWLKNLYKIEQNQNQKSLILRKIEVIEN